MILSGFKKSYGDDPSRTNSGAMNFEFGEKDSDGSLLPPGKIGSGKIGGVTRKGTSLSKFKRNQSSVNNNSKRSIRDSIDENMEDSKLEDMDNLLIPKNPVSDA
jgi:hypothetical protein